jgi:hypothetical protein
MLGPSRQPRHRPTALRVSKIGTWEPVCEISGLPPCERLPGSAHNRCSCQLSGGTTQPHRPRSRWPGRWDGSEPRGSQHNPLTFWGSVRAGEHDLVQNPEPLEVRTLVRTPTRARGRSPELLGKDVSTSARGTRRGSTTPPSAPCQVPCALTVAEAEALACYLLDTSPVRLGRRSPSEGEGKALLARRAAQRRRAGGNGGPASSQSFWHLR